MFANRVTPAARAADLRGLKKLAPDVFFGGAPDGEVPDALKIEPGGKIGASVSKNAEATA